MVVGRTVLRLFHRTPLVDRFSADRLIGFLKPRGASGGLFYGNHVLLFRFFQLASLRHVIVPANNWLLPEKVVAAKSRLKCALSLARDEMKINVLSIGRPIERWAQGSILSLCFLLNVFEVLVGG